MTMRSKIAGFVVAVSSMGAISAHADIAVLQIPGVPGESTLSGFRDWINATSLSVAVTDRVCAGFTVMKPFDRSSPILSADALSGMVYPTMTVLVQRAGEGQRPYLTYVLTNSTVFSIGTTYSPGGALVEGVTFRPSHISLTYYPQDEKGGFGAAVASTLACKYK